jgi:N-acetylneuraminic acid mutarotase
MKTGKHLFSHSNHWAHVFYKKGSIPFIFFLCNVLSNVFFVQFASAQAPQAFPYQAVARDNSGNLLANQAISIRFNVLDGSNSGPSVYQERHNTSTNALGLFNVHIGQGTVLSGAFNSIAWGSGSKFLKIELDPAGGNSFTVMGTTQLLSVPYALYANNAGGSSGSGLPNGTSIGNTTFWNGTSWVVNNSNLFNNGASIGVGTNTPAASAKLDISSTTQGLLIPRMTTTQRDAIPTPAIGLQVFNLDDQCVDLYDGANWIKTCGLKVTGTVSDPNHSSANSWVQRTSLPISRNNAVAFTIGNKAYIGLGSFLGMSYYDDFYEYDPSTNVWSQKANFPAGARADAVAFSINGKGYVTTGGNGAFVNYDMWEYDPIADIWTQKSNCPGSARWKAQGFSIGGKGYLGLGTDGSSDLNDMWEYDPSNDTWTQKANYPGNGRQFTMGLSVNGKGYIGLGTDVNGNYNNDVWQYDPSTNTWTSKQAFPGIGFHSMSCFSMNGNGYIGTGYNGATEMSDFWEYNASTDTWTSKANYSGAARKNAVGFAIGNKGYIATGLTSTIMPQNDVWSYMDNNVTGNVYSNTVINTTNNAVNDGAWTLYNNQVYNSNSGNVGVGTSAPTNKLSVVGNVDIAGNVGIGNTNPTSPLTLTGNMDISGEIKNNGVGGLNGQILVSNGNGSMSWINNTGGGGGSSPWVSSGNDIKNSNLGNVGIGSFPSAGIKLDVSGNGRFAGDKIVSLNDKGCFSTLTSTGLVTSFLNQLSIDGQRIQASGGINSFSYNPSAQNIYLNPLGGNVGIGTTTAHAALQFNNIGMNRKIILFEDANNDQQYYGFGINSAALRYQVGHTGASHIFHAGNGSSSSVELMRINGNGNVGIGVASPDATLQVKRGTGFYGTAAFEGTTYNSHFNYSTDEHTYIRGGKNFSRVYINELNGGKVIIGNITSLPVGYRLYVEQGILTERLRVAVNNSGSWADYVFADDYKLMPLEEVEAYIKEHNHLPNVPSADQMVENGIDVATVDAKLMEKIEELTLYMIEMKKEMKKLANENASIKSRCKIK